MSKVVRLTIGQAMAQARMRAGLSQRKLAERAGVNVMSLNGYECDQHTPNLIAVIELADALGLSIDEYVGHTVIEKEDNNESEF